MYAGKKLNYYIRRGLMVMAIMFMVYIAYDVVRMISADSKRRANVENDYKSTMTDIATATDLATTTDAVSSIKEGEDSLENKEVSEAVNLETKKYMEAIPSHKTIDMEIVYQYPELPTGCESVALTIILKFYGFTDLEKTTIASDYLIYADSYVTGYYGDPFSYGGAGIYPPGLVKTTNNFLKDRRSLLNAKDITGSSPQTLYKYVANGKPVVVWNTIHMYSNNPSGSYRTYNGRTYHWDTSEHCVVFSGYDFNRNVVIIHDPVDGIVERDADTFWARYENLGSMAMILQ